MSNKLLQFDQATAEKIMERDNYLCFFCERSFYMKCSSPMLLRIPDIMHLVNKSQGGLGIEENGVLGCRYHHGLLDNGNKGLRPEMLEMLEVYLKEHYVNWTREAVIFKKYNFVT